MHFQREGLNTTVTLPVERLWRCIAQRTRLGGRYRLLVQYVYNFMFLAVNSQRNFSGPTLYFELVTVK